MLGSLVVGIGKGLVEVGRRLLRPVRALESKTEKYISKRKPMPAGFAWITFK